MLISKELMKQIRHIQLRAGHLATDTLAGEYSSAFRGLGQEFDRVREYFIGDDVRTIDWNVTARMREPYVKIYREEREMTLMLMVDVSPSQGFGTSGRFKQEIAAELAAILAFLAIKNHDKVGLIVFSDHVEQYIRPQKGRAHVWNMIRSVLSHQSQGRSTDLAGALTFLTQVCKRKSLCFLISDFAALGYEPSLKIAAKRHDLVCALTCDEREQKLPECGFINFGDAETGETLVCNTSDARVRQALAELAEQEEAALHNLLKKQRVDYFRVPSHSSVVTPLIHYLKQRERRQSSRHSSGSSKRFSP